MRIASWVFGSASLAGFSWSASAQMRAVPPIFYLRSCISAGAQTGMPVATCRQMDGAYHPRSLAAVGRCVGNISNNNGLLQCNHCSGHAAAAAPPLAICAPPHPEPKSPPALQDGSAGSTQPQYCVEVR